MEPPTMQEELDRKTVETLDNFVRRSEIGELSDRDVKVAAAALWGATAGMLPEQTQQIIGIAASADSTAPKTITRTWLDNEGKFARSIAWTPGTTTVYAVGDKVMRKVECENPRAARDAFSKLCKAWEHMKELGR